MYDVFVLKAYARPLKSLAKPIKAFFASSLAKRGLSAELNNVPIFPNAAESNKITVAESQTSKNTRSETAAIELQSNL